MSVPCSIVALNFALDAIVYLHTNISWTILCYLETLYVNIFKFWYKLNNVQLKTVLSRDGNTIRPSFSKPSQSNEFETWVHTKEIDPLLWTHIWTKIRALVRDWINSSLGLYNTYVHIDEHLCHLVAKCIWLMWKCDVYQEVLFISPHYFVAKEIVDA